MKSGLTLFLKVMGVFFLVSMAISSVLYFSSVLASEAIDARFGHFAGLVFSWIGCQSNNALIQAIEEPR